MPVFELQGVNFENKGAELMLFAALEHFNSLPGDRRLAMPFRIGSFAQRKAIGMGHLLYLHREPAAINAALAFAAQVLPSRMRSGYAIYAPSHISGMVDAAGFRYSDQWPVASLEVQARKVRRLKAAGKPVIYLPQAFGPFSRPQGQALIRTVAENADLVFARDAVSHRHLVGAAGDLPQIRRAPDFTNLIAPRIEGPALDDNVVFIVPNARMVDKTSPEIAERYIESLVLAAKTAQERGMQPVVMIHDAIGDRAIAETIQSKAGQRFRELTHSDPRVLKGWLAQARGMVGSRFHALVSALSSGTPAISLGWSHKYGELMGDYGQPELNLTVDDNERLVETLVGWTDDSRRQATVDAIDRHSAVLKKATLEMWRQVDQVVMPAR